MKRSDALEPLSHDHYQGLQMATRLRKALAANKDATALAEVARGFWHNHLVPHFSEEERHLLPILDNVAPDLAERLRREHREIERLETDLSDQPDSIAAFAAALAAHIRFEEREVFPAIERLAEPAQLERLGKRLDRGAAEAAH